MNRPGFDMTKASERYLSKIIFVDVPNIEIAGTDIRMNIRLGKSIRYLVPEKVRKYIVKNGLYRESESVSQ
jgi:nicotinate-nucleotide adenylyltransferase